jgi:hypothetical protein
MATWLAPVSVPLTAVGRWSAAARRRERVMAGSRLNRARWLKPLAARWGLSSSVRGIAFGRGQTCSSCGEQ